MWFCGAANTSQTGPWWVGNTEVATPCESGRQVIFTDWPSANVVKIIQRPTSASSPASPTTSSTDQAESASSSTFSTTSAPSSTVSATLVGSSIDDLPVDMTRQASDPSGSGGSLSLALGAGLGIPLGIATIGFLAFLFWRIRRQNKPSHTSSGFAQGQKSITEVSLDQTARELSGGEAGQEMWAENPRQVPEIDSRQNYELGTR